jgi:DNA-binding NtrC family response regulator
MSFNEYKVANEDGSPLTLEELEKRHIEAVLRMTGFNKRRAAAILGIARSTIILKVRRYKIAPPVVHPMY